MPSGLKQPIGQKRLTNVAVVRLRKGGVVFEIACYKNKVSNWRAEIETDLDEVLQTTVVFTNVSKGIVAKEKQLRSSFGTTDEETICLEILAKGELQVSEKERKLEYDNLYKDVASVIAEKCIDPQTRRQYTATIIERALKDVHFNPDVKKSAKQQAFGEALPLLQERFSIRRANMRIQLHVPTAHKQAVEHMIQAQNITTESSRVDEGARLVLMDCLIEPGMYRTVNRLLDETTRGTGRIELMNLTAVHETPPPPTRERPLPEEPSGQEAAEAMDAPAMVTTKSVARHAVDDRRHVIYARGDIAGLPEDFARKEMFSEIDALEEGWQVELVQNPDSDVVQATFYSPNGTRVGPFAKARRQALDAKKGP